VQLLAENLPVSNSSFRNGLKNTHLLGRFQLINDKIPILLDVGHNVEAVRTLVEYINMTFPGKRIHAIFSMLKDKDIAGVIEIMNPVIYDWFFAPLANPRATSESNMREIFSNNGVTRVSFGFTGFTDAFNAAKHQSLDNDLLLVFGSFFLVSDCLNNLKR
jgi:dihydrofolate synthase/folylpolyglutamate synthase